MNYTSGIHRSIGPTGFSIGLLKLFGYILETPLGLTKGGFDRLQNGINILLQPPLLLLLPLPFRPACLHYIAVLLLRLLNLLIDLLTALGAIPVVQEHSARIRDDLELGANDRKTSLD